MNKNINNSDEKIFNDFTENFKIYKIPTNTYPNLFENEIG